ncbi:SgcJ/EcaC family oxidoreductase [Sulfuriroseicoccus oceanibius]|uniref:SgcJ/EcaC family oxidoreductase n=1 Tax=Sulfuriroseicoccus oceanibius TaxID=2707525 RepID=A0A6B3L6Z6_9BACT|nr:SgcJ/EcaC family oxidoreductase [Sulfuriroseicoccus oceanibius]QQL45611.1 SgcJ/EcaC family oxidoreductase [Sulfuriroseicoccus oceanibius]
MKRLLRSVMLAVWLGGSLCGVGLADEEVSEADKVVADLAEAYRKAYAARDADALAAMYAEDCRYTWGGREPIIGRDAVKERVVEFFTGAKSAQMEIVTTDARMLTPEVIVEKGVVSVTVDGEEKPEVAKYSATYVKRGDKWLIADLNESAVQVPEDPAAEALLELDWLIGDWKYGEPGRGAKMAVQWALGGKFIYRSYEIERPERELMRGAEMIGYDPAKGVLRSWVFDSEGGIGTATWQREGDKWLVSVKSILPDGTQSSEHQIYTVNGDVSFFFEGMNRMVDGEALPNTERVEIMKVKPAP